MKDFEHRRSATIKHYLTGQASTEEGSTATAHLTFSFLRHQLRDEGLHRYARFVFPDLEGIIGFDDHLFQVSVIFLFSERKLPEETLIRRYPNGPPGRRSTWTEPIQKSLRSSSLQGLSEYDLSY